MPFVSLANRSVTLRSLPLGLFIVGMLKVDVTLPLPLPFVLTSD